MYISGHLPITPSGTLITGRIGPSTGGETIEHGYEAARHAGLNIVSTLKKQLGDLDRVEQIVKVSFYLQIGRQSTCLMAIELYIAGLWNSPVDRRLQGTTSSNGWMLRRSNGNI